MAQSVTFLAPLCTLCEIIMSLLGEIHSRTLPIFIERANKSGKSDTATEIAAQTSHWNGEKKANHWIRSTGFFINNRIWSRSTGTRKSTTAARSAVNVNSEAAKWASPRINWPIMPVQFRSPTLLPHSPSAGFVNSKVKFIMDWSSRKISGNIPLKHSLLLLLLLLQPICAFST